MQNRLKFMIGSSAPNLDSSRQIWSATPNLPRGVEPGSDVQAGERAAIWQQLFGRF